MNWPNLLALFSVGSFFSTQHTFYLSYEVEVDLFITLVEKILIPSAMILGYTNSSIKTHSCQIILNTNLISYISLITHYINDVMLSNLLYLCESN